MQSLRYSSSGSSKISHSTSSRETTILPGSQENSACPTSNIPNECIAVPTRSILESSSSTPQIRAENAFSGWPRSITVTVNDVLRLFHVENFSNASEDEIMFFFHLFSEWTGAAKRLARDANGKCDRALQAVVTAIESSMNHSNPDYNLFQRDNRFFW